MTFSLERKSIRKCAARGRLKETHTLGKPLMCTRIIVISSVRFSCSNHILYDSPAMAAHASWGSVYLATYIKKETKKIVKGTNGKTESKGKPETI